ncbi:hypothetical protein ACWD0J_13245 [Streptomyces sp. NPDC003011]
MTVDQLPGQVREFANYLDGLLARLDQGGGWCGVFWQRDPDGMQACLDGREMPPWDVVEALLQDFAAQYGHQVAGAEAEHARALYAAALLAYDACPGARDALGDRFDVMLREQRYAAERQAGLGRALASATTQEEADALRLDLAWARDDHERATRRCAELRSRMADLDRRATGGQAQALRRKSGGEGAVFRAADGFPADDVRSGGDASGAPGRSGGSGGPGGPGDTGLDGRGPGGHGPDGRASGDARSGDMGSGGTGIGTGSGTGSGGVRTDGHGSNDAWPDGRGGAGGGTGPQGLDADGARPSDGHGRASARPDGHGPGGARGDAYGSDTAQSGGYGSYGEPGFDGSGFDESRFDGPEFDGRGGSYGGGFPSMPRQREEQAAAEVTGWRAAERGAAGAPDGGDARREDPDAPAGQWSSPTGTPDPRWPAPAETSGPQQPAPPPQWSSPAGTPAVQEPAPKQRKRRRGSARFAGMAEEEAATVVPPASAPDLPTAPAATGRTPRGARFAGAARGSARSQPQAEPLDAVDRRETAETVERLVRLRGEGRSGEAHALLAEIAYWSAARYPLLAVEMRRAGLGADWATLLWEAASLPADRLVAAADALVAAGCDSDGEQILRQGVARPAAEIGQAVLALAAEGRRREVRALLDAYVRVRTPEEAARSAEPGPQTLVPLLVEAARGVSDERHWDLVHALRVAGFTA